MATRTAGLALVATLVLAGCSSAGHKSPAPGASASRSAAAASTSTVQPPAVTSLAATTEPWVLPAPVSRPVVVPDGPAFVVLGGLATGDTSTSRVIEVDPGTGQGRLVGHLALAVHDAAGAAIGGRFVVFGGGSYSTVSGVQAWTPAGASEVAHLPAARSDLSAATLAGVTYIVGGYDGTGMTPDVLATTDGLTFRTVGRLAVPVRYAAVAALGGALWVMGGVTSTSEGGTGETDAIQRVDLSTGQVSITGRLPQATGHATALVLAGHVFLVGGRSASTPSSAIWRLAADGTAVAPAGQLPGARSDAGSVVLGDVGYIVGGEVTGPAQPLDTVILLQPH